MKHIKLDYYLEDTASKYTVHGFEYNGLIYGYIPTSEELHALVRISRASTAKGGYETLKLNKLRKETRQSLILTNRAKVICTKEYLENECKTYGLTNKGMGFEQILSLQNGCGLYVKGDKRPYYESGDIVINGEQVQVKYEECTLARIELIDRIHNERR